jgi:tRNA(His) 5'-end guanylyltransferase
MNWTFYFMGVNVMVKDSIGNRMKDNYENRYRLKLTRRMPVIIRLDGKAFHTVTRGCVKPFDETFRCSMGVVATTLCDEIQGAKCAYVQSDEISILLTDFDRLTTDAWFDNNLQKMVSVSAGIASARFSTSFLKDGRIAVFDSRAFNIPKEEVCNYFIWRQQDWLRNSIQMLAQSLYSHKELQNQNTGVLHEMCHAKGVNWADLNCNWKNGVFFYKTSVGWLSTGDVVFTKDRGIIEQYMKPIEE